jgi:peptidoglycan hydrolase-like protein with peptidoglycan-binding domain
MADNKPTPKPVAPKSVEKPKVETIEVKPVPVEVVEEVKVEAPKVETPAKRNVPATAYAVVSGGQTDPVHLSKAQFKSVTHKRSLTVHHLQRRLMEWGYMDAYLDKDGYFGDLTLKSINEFRTAHGIESNLPLDAETFSAIFEGDTNVNVVID